MMIKSQGVGFRIIYDQDGAKRKDQMFLSLRNKIQDFLKLVKDVAIDFYTSTFVVAHFELDVYQIGQCYYLMEFDHKRMNLMLCVLNLKPKQFILLCMDDRHINFMFEINCYKHIVYDGKQSMI